MDNRYTLTRAGELSDELISIRRKIHQNPEIGFDLPETTALVAEKLKAYGIEFKKVGKAGISAVLGNAEAGGKTFLLRADMDALPFEELTGLTFASNNGCMHACGHDNHMAMLLGAAKILTTIRDEIPGTVKLLFQPAEETAQGAKAMIAEGVLKGVDAIYGAHIWGDFDAPYIDVSAGNRMACCDTFRITVEGSSTHGSTPHLGTDAIVAAASIIMNIQTIVSRNNDPLNPLVVTVGKIDGGQRFNILANKVVMEGTCRTFSRKTLETIDKDLERIAANTAAAFGASASLEYQHLTTPVINDHEDLNRIARNAVIKLYGEEGLGHLPTMMGSEDFAFFMEEVPGVFGFIGSRDPEQGYIYTNHHEKYSVPEEVLQRGAAMHAQFALDFLTEKAGE